MTKREGDLAIRDKVLNGFRRSLAAPGMAPGDRVWTAQHVLAAGCRTGDGSRPHAEFLAVRDFKSGASTNWDILPEMQITVSRRQHVRIGFGVRKPFTNTRERTPQVLFYLLWDRAEGKLWQGWR